MIIRARETHREKETIGKREREQERERSSVSSDRLEKNISDAQAIKLGLLSTRNNSRHTHRHADVHMSTWANTHTHTPLAILQHCVD